MKEFKDIRITLLTHVLVKHGPSRAPRCEVSDYRTRRKKVVEKKVKSKQLRDDD